MLVGLEIKRNQAVLSHLFSAIIQEDGFLCGGFARVCLSQRKRPIPSSDIDIYCYSEAGFTAIQGRMAKMGYSIQFESEVAETYQYVARGAMPLQLIKPKNQGAIIGVGNVEDILGAFDFTIARAAIFLQNGTLHALADASFVDDENHRRLVIKNIHCPVAQVYRIAKYMQKGYKIKTIEVIRVLVDWEQRDPEYKSRLLSMLEKDNPSQFEIQELEKLLHWD